MTDEDRVRRDFPSARVRCCERRGRHYYMVGVYFGSGPSSRLVWTPWWKTPERAWAAAAARFCKRKEQCP